MYIEVNGARLFYRVTGKGEPLLFVHGNGEDQKIFYINSDKIAHLILGYLLPEE